MVNDRIENVGNTLKKILISITWSTKDDNQFYTKIFSGEALFNE